MKLAALSVYIDCLDWGEFHGPQARSSECPAAIVSGCLGLSMPSGSFSLTGLSLNARFPLA